MSNEENLERAAEPEREQPPAAGIEDIRPSMSAEDKQRALKEILRVLRGEK